VGLQHFSQPNSPARSEAVRGYAVLAGADDRRRDLGDGTRRDLKGFPDYPRPLSTGSPETRQDRLLDRTLVRSTRSRMPSCSTSIFKVGRLRRARYLPDARAVRKNAHFVIIWHGDREAHLEQDGLSCLSRSRPVRSRRRWPRPVHGAYYFGARFTRLEELPWSDQDSQKHGPTM
jgi:hypothetical protein